MLEIVLKKADSFYKVEDRNLLIAQYRNVDCFNIKCYDRECGCDCTDSCDLELGETIKSIYPTATLISKDEFEKLWKECE